MALPFSFSSELKWSDHLNQMHGPFENGTDLYVVLLDKTNNHVEVWRSTDNGDSWAEQDSANHKSLTTTATRRVCDVTKLGTTLYIQYDQPTGTFPAWTTFDLSANTWGSVVAQSIQPNVNVSGQHARFLSVRSDGDYIVLYNGPTESVMGTAYRRVQYARREVTTWTQNVDVAGIGGQVHYDARTIILGSSDRVHFFWTDVTNGDLKHRSLSSANVLGAIQDVDTTIDGNWFYLVGLPILNGSEIVLPYKEPFAANDLVVARATSADTPTWSTFQTITSTNDPEHSLSNPVCLLLDGSIVYAVWVHDDQDIWYDNDAGSGTWGTDVEFKDAITCQGINAAKVTNGIGVLYDDGGTIKYDFISLAAAFAGKVIMIIGDDF